MNSNICCRTPEQIFPEPLLSVQLFLESFLTSVICSWSQGDERLKWLHPGARGSITDQLGFLCLLDLDLQDFREDTQKPPDPF